MRRSSQQTKAVILAAAREQFAAAGYEAATIRSIAAAAEIDPSMVMRYFGNKDKLFAAAAEFDLRLPDLSGVAEDDLGARLVGHFLDRWEDDDALVVLLRSSTTNADAAQRMREIVHRAAETGDRHPGARGGGAASRADRDPDAGYGAVPSGAATAARRRAVAR